MNTDVPIVASDSKRYALAALLVVAAVALERLVQAPAGMRFPGLLYAAIVATAWYGGAGPTMFALVVGMLASWALLADADAVPDGEALETLLVFVVVAGGTAAIVIALRRMRAQALRLRRQTIAAEAEAAELRRTIENLSQRLVAESDWHAITLRSIADAVLSTDADGRILTLNATAETWTGWSSSDARGVPFEQVCRIVDPDCGDAAAMLRDDLKAGRVTARKRELQLFHRDGSMRHVTVAGVPIVDPDGRCAGAVLTLHDVTGRHEAAEAQQALLDTARAAERSARSAQLALEAAHEKFSAFMTNFPYPAFIQDERGGFVFVNRAGLASGAWREAAHAGDAPDMQPQTISIAAADRHYFSIRFPIAIEGKVWLGGIAIDISERIRAERALSERTADFETLFDNVPAPLWIARDALGTQIVGNDAANRLLGRAPADDRAATSGGERTWRFEREGHPIDPAQTPIQVALREARIVDYTDLEVVRGDGTRSHISVTAAPLFDAKGHVRGAVAAALDISQLKAYEAELQTAVRRRDEFLAVLAHELRNPLAPIRNSVQILQKVPADVERVRRATATIDRQTSLLVRLIDDLLDVARISQGVVELDVAPRTIEATVQGAIETARTSFGLAGRELRIEHEEPKATMLIDGLRAEQILLNLLSNAIKYSPPQSEIRVRSWVESGFAKIAVTDRGRGIRAEFLPQLFTMFARPGADARTRVGGLGVGLALAKRLAEQQGGGIDVASEGQGRGATFTVWFPLARAAANEVQ